MVGILRAELIADVGRRHGLSESATRVLWEALVAGHGTQAQFNHPELGGMGQWSGGMAQIGDMFNTGLKARILGACADLAGHAAQERRSVAAAGSHQSQRQGDGTGPWPMAETPGGPWWPEGLGAPSSTGSQNDTRYALFPQRARLALQRNGVVTLYDTGEHRISGFGQQQSGAASMSFTSQFGPVRLESLRRVEAGGAAPEPAASPRVPMGTSASLGVASQEEKSHEIEASIPVGAPSPLTGGCLCGQVRYVAEGAPFGATLCHCVDCRRAAGAPAVAWFTVARRHFRFVSGVPAVFRSSERAIRRFCPTCGTQLTWEGHAMPNDIDITTASLDHPDRVPPRAHSYARSRIAWDRLDETLPEKL